MSNICQKNFTITVNNVTCPDWSTLAFAVAPTKWHQGLWLTYPLTYTLAGGVFTIDMVNTDVSTNQCALYNSNASLLFTGGPCNCLMSVNLSSWTWPPARTGGVGFKVFQDGVQVATFSKGESDPGGNYLVPFSLIAGVNSVVEVRPGIFDGAVGGPVDTVFAYGFDSLTLNVSAVVTFTNV